MPHEISAELAHQLELEQRANQIRAAILHDQAFVAELLEHYRARDTEDWIDLDEFERALIAMDAEG